MSERTTNKAIGLPQVLNRWHAEVVYITSTGPLMLEHDFEEMEELHDLIEAGPSFGAIDTITVRYVGPADPHTIDPFDFA